MFLAMFSLFYVCYNFPSCSYSLVVNHDVESCIVNSFVICLGHSFACCLSLANHGYVDALIFQVGSHFWWYIIWRLSVSLRIVDKRSILKSPKINDKFINSYIFFVYCIAVLYFLHAVVSTSNYLRPCKYIGGLGGHLCAAVDAYKLPWIQIYSVKPSRNLLWTMGEPPPRHFYSLWFIVVVFYVI